MAFSKGLGAVHSMSHAIGANENMRLHHGTPTVPEYEQMLADAMGWEDIKSLDARVKART